MPLAPGTRLGFYEIVSSLGAGGMGEVYHGRDTRLGRDVALKILPDLVARDPERLARFDREAKLLAALAHPNIATLYALEQIDGRPVLVMELAAGEDLSRRIDRGPLPLDEALSIARQVAAALEAAHDKGIVHRDLKPANIKVDADSSVKVLDFGLAKAFGADDVDSTSAMNSPTVTAQATAAGVILGTAAYMSPEQARGRAADKRADIWSFGVVLFEMLTGRQLFHGETISDTLAAVLRQDIDFAAFPADMPAELRRLLRRCLERDRKDRLHDIADARIVLDEIARGDTVSAAIAPTVKPRFPLWTVAIWTVAVAGLGVLLGLTLARDAVDPNPVRFVIAAPEGVTWINTPVFSPDGKLLVFRGTVGTRTDLYLQPLDEFPVRRLDRTEEASSPFFSPDGKWIGFYREGTLEKISIDGGDPLTLVKSFPFGTGVVWMADGSLIVQPTWVEGLAVIDRGSQKPRPLTTPDPKRGERAHWFPQALPDGRHLLFTIMRRGAGANDSEVAVVEAATGEYRVVLEQAAEGRFVPPGFLVFIRAGVYHAIRFDPASQTVLGEPIRVLPDARGILPDGEKVPVAVSTSGTLAYVPGPRLLESQLVWVAERGKQELLPYPPRTYIDASVSSDGLHAAVSVIEGGRYLLHVLGLDRNRPSDRVLDLPGSNWLSFWHPKDNRQLAFRSMRKGDFDTFTKDVMSSDPAKEFLATDFDDSPLGWIPPDGKFMLVSQSTPAGRYPIQQVEVAEPSKMKVLVDEPLAEIVEASPDGRWLAMVLTRGRQEIYVRPLFRDGVPVPISAKGGQAVAWSRSRRELLYARPPEIVAVPYTEVDGEFKVQPERIFARVDRLWPDYIFDTGPDGRVLVQQFSGRYTNQIRVIPGYGRELERQFNAR